MPVIRVTDAIRRDYIVVVFGSSSDGWCELSHCPMHAHGPFTQEEARQVADGMPAWMQPHILTIDTADDACVRIAAQSSSST